MSESLATSMRAMPLRNSASTTGMKREYKEVYDKESGEHVRHLSEL
ncbi:MAG: hypothetical protein K2I08_12090 [Muribaculaceae bacterium]|nr:hypothetical protein [Muribaculaceae bacterium]MDE6786360.1 hypothetical protein [Muribaculaceae bacterium]